MKEYQTSSVATTTHHIRKITLTGEQNNNKMERLNGEKVTRNLKKDDSPILTGLQIYHNYVRGQVVNSNPECESQEYKALRRMFRTPFSCRVQSQT
jgi:hypothetical protein